MNTYDWLGIYQFTDAEIDQIIQLCQQWSMGPIKAIDRRKYSPNVQKYACAVNLLNWQCKKHGTEADNIWLACERCASKWPTSQYFRLVFPKDLHQFSPRHHLPLEALWRIVKEHILMNQASIGFSAASKQGWWHLGIAPDGHKWATEKDYTQKLDILHHLATYGLIIFQHAGSVWQITVKEQ